MANNISIHPTETVRLAVEAFERDSSLEALLQALELAMSNKRHEAIKRLAALVDAKPGLFAPDLETSNTWRFGEWLALIDFRFDDGDSEQSVEPKPTENDDKARVVKGIVDAVQKAMQQIDREPIARNPSNPYGMFMAGYEIKEFLEAQFPDRNPGVVIGEYYRAFFPYETECTWSAEPRRSVWVSEDAMRLLARICLVLGKQNMAQESHADLALGGIDSKSISELAALGAGRMATAFFALAHLLANPPSKRQDLSGSSSIDWSALARIVFSAPPLLSEPLLRLIKQLDPPDKEGQIQVLDTMSRVPIGPERYWACPSDELLVIPELEEQRANFARAFLPWSVVANIWQILPWDMDSHTLEYTERDWEIADAAVKRILRNVFVASKQAGRQRMWLTLPSVYDLLTSALKTRDGGFMIGSDSEAYSELFEQTERDVRWILGLQRTELGESEFCFSTYFERGIGVEGFPLRTRRILEAVEAASDARFDELACALLSFLFISEVAVGTQELSLPHAEIVETIQKLKGSPGYDMVDRALVAILSGPFGESASPEALSLRSLLKPSNRTEVPPQLEPRFIGASRDELHARLVNTIGTEQWIKLDPTTKTMLVDAVVAYSRCHLELVEGIENWGSLALGFAKGVENELMFRFDPVFGSPEWRNCATTNLNRGKPTLGTITNLLQRLPQIDQALRQVVEHYGLNDLCRLLPDLTRLKDLRNPAAHSGPFTSAQFLEMKKLCLILIRQL